MTTCIDYSSKAYHWLWHVIIIIARCFSLYSWSLLLVRHASGKYRKTTDASRLLSIVPQLLHHDITLLSAVSLVAAAASTLVTLTVALAPTCWAVTANFLVPYQMNNIDCFLQVFPPTSLPKQGSGNCELPEPTSTKWTLFIWLTLLTPNRARRQSRFLMFISCQRQDPNVLPKRWQSHQGDKHCDVSTVPSVARPYFWPADLTRTANPILQTTHFHANKLWIAIEAEPSFVDHMGCQESIPCIFITTHFYQIFLNGQAFSSPVCLCWWQVWRLICKVSTNGTQVKHTGHRQGRGVRLSGNVCSLHLDLVPMAITWKDGKTRCNYKQEPKLYHAYGGDQWSRKSSRGGPGNTQALKHLHCTGKRGCYCCCCCYCKSSHHEPCPRTMSPTPTVTKLKTPTFQGQT